MHTQSIRILFPSLLLWLGGCGSAHPDQLRGSSELGLQVSPNGTISSATYTIAGPNGFASAGMVPVTDTLDVLFALSQLPVGQGYELELNAVASDGVTVCEGSSGFDVVDSTATLTLVVQLACAVPSGDLSVTTTLNICPVVDGLDASPLALTRAGVSSLSATAHDSDQGPAPLSYAWAANGFKLAKQTAPTLRFVCTSPGQFSISVGVSDGDPTPSCTDSLAAQVSCQ